MTNLTNTERKVLNNMSQVLDRDVKLGDKIQEVIACTSESGTPVNAVAALNSLTVSGVSVHGETITIGPHVYEFLADAAQKKTVSTNVPINISANSPKATVSMTIDTQPTSGDTMTIGTKTYIFVPVGTANGPGEISIGADLDAAKLAIVAAINGTDGVNQPHQKVTASAFTANICTITALIGGVAGNAIVSTETFAAATNVFGSATLTGGADCNTSKTCLAIVMAISTNEASLVECVGDGSEITIQAKVAGVAGNSIPVSTTMARGAFMPTTTTLVEGVDGTVATGTKFMVDDTYLYVCLAGNTTAQANWRRVSLGSAY